MVLMGIESTYPSREVMVYIVPREAHPVMIDGRLDCPARGPFPGKPSWIKPGHFWTRGAKWNGVGVFAFKLGYLLDIVNRNTGDCEF
ncbi:MAG: hypothetical protein ACLTBV_09070 [Enterocloster bolteae]